MQTPAGTECPYFYGNYFRGREQEECRLIGNTPSPGNWTPKLCFSCPVPEIIRANACKNMILSAKVKKRPFGFKREVVVSAYCTQTKRTVEKPEIGCGECHPLPPFLTGEDS